MLLACRPAPGTAPARGSRSRQVALVSLWAVSCTRSRYGIRVSDRLSSRRRSRRPRSRPSPPSTTSLAAVASGDEVVARPAEDAVAAATRTEVVGARAAHEHVVPAEADEHVGAAEAADHVAPPRSHEPVGPVRADDRAAEEPAALVAGTGRRAERRGRAGRRARGARSDDPEPVAPPGREAREPERDAGRGRTRRKPDRRRAGRQRPAAAELDPDLRLEPAGRDVGADERSRERDARRARPADGRQRRRSGTRRPRRASCRRSSGRRGARGTRYPARARSRSPRRRRRRAPTPALLASVRVPYDVVGPSSNQKVVSRGRPDRRSRTGRRRSPRGEPGP